MSGNAAHDSTAARNLLTPEAIRARTRMVFDAACAGETPHFRVHPDRLPATAEMVIADIRAAYPDLNVPFHSRWRHFELGGHDLWADLMAQLDQSDVETAATAADLAIVSVLLDAGAGPDWSYRDADTGLELGRSEGLALASIRMFEAGLFSSDPADSYRVDADGLAALSDQATAEAMQSTDPNPLHGLADRAELLRTLGRVIASDPVFRHDAISRPGNLLRLLLSASENDVAARDILIAVLVHLGPIWPEAMVLDGVSIGDAGRHPAARTDDQTSGIVPFHKLSQWLSYSLIEPLQWAGTTVTDIDGLTGLAEYRNGGLFVDSGVLEPVDPSVLQTVQEPDSELIVEWRALTVVLLDRIADEIRAQLGRDSETLPLASILQGGTWATGRRLAREKRSDGGPPIPLNTKATLF